MFQLHLQLGHIPNMLDDLVGVPVLSNNEHEPVRLKGNGLHKYSKVVMSDTTSDVDNFKQNPLPVCRVLSPAPASPLEEVPPNRLFHTDIQ